eukprot:7680316-Ditylum_brightwellii.AAC.1
MRIGFDDSYEQNISFQLVQGQRLILCCLKQGLVKCIGLILSGNENTSFQTRARRDIGDLLSQTRPGQ